jgi:hypothetical protein
LHHWAAPAAQSIQENEMKAYLIDPFTKTISMVEYSGDYNEIYKLIECDTFTCADFNSFGDTVFVDDEGLINGKDQEFFLIGDYPSPLAGKALVLGTNQEGESVEPSMTIEQVAVRVDWIPNIYTYHFA